MKCLEVSGINGMGVWCQQQVRYNGTMPQRKVRRTCEYQRCSKKTGLTSKAIRFMKKKGLVTPPLRGENGYRTYGQQHLNELTLLRQRVRWDSTLKSVVSW